MQRCDSSRINYFRLWIDGVAGCAAGILAGAILNINIGLLMVWELPNQRMSLLLATGVLGCIFFVSVNHCRPRRAWFHRLASIILD